MWGWQSPSTEQSTMQSFISTHSPGTGEGQEEGNQWNHAYIVLKSKYLPILKTVSLQTDPNKRAGTNTPQMKDGLHRGSAAATSWKKDAQNRALGSVCWIHCQQVPPKNENPMYLLESPDERNVSSCFLLCYGLCLCMKQRKFCREKRSLNMEMQPQKQKHGFLKL